MTKETEQCDWGLFFTMAGAQWVVTEALGFSELSWNFIVLVLAEELFLQILGQFSDMRRKM